MVVRSGYRQVVYHVVVRLVIYNIYMVVWSGYRQVVCLDVVSLVIYIISTIVRSGYRQVVCHDVVSLVMYYFHGREVGLRTGGMPRCREFCYILFPWS